MDDTAMKKLIGARIRRTIVDAKPKPGSNFDCFCDCYNELDRDAQIVVELWIDEIVKAIKHKKPKMVFGPVQGAELLFQLIAKGFIQ